MNKWLLMLQKGMTKEQILAKAVEDEGFNQEEFVKEFELAMKAFNAEKALNDKAEADKKDADFQAKVKAAVDAQVKAALEAMPVKSKADNVQVKENPEAWKVETGKQFKLMHKQANIGLSVEETQQLKDINERNMKKWADVYGEKTLTGIITSTDSQGGYFNEPTFDMEVDKLVATRSGLIDRVKVRMGDEKTLINGISGLYFRYRTNQNTAFTAQLPNFTQAEIKYEDAGTLTTIANRMFGGSAYNLSSELTELVASAKLKMMEKTITTGKASTADPDDASQTYKFNGIWFTSSVSTYAAAATTISDADLTNAYLTAPAETRALGVFIMDSRELMVLMNKKDDTGRPIEYVVNVNGKFIHKATGKEIIVSDWMIRNLNGTTNYTDGSNVAVIFGELERFRFYQLGGMRISMSKDRYFEYDQTGLLFMNTHKLAIPTNSLSSFVLITGLEYAAVS